MKSCFSDCRPFSRDAVWKTSLVQALFHNCRIQDSQCFFFKSIWSWLSLSSTGKAEKPVIKTWLVFFVCFFLLLVFFCFFFLWDLRCFYLGPCSLEQVDFQAELCRYGRAEVFSKCVLLNGLALSPRGSRYCSL